MQLLQTSTPFLRTSHNPSMPSAVLPVVLISIKSYLSVGVITTKACAYALMVDSVQAKAALPLTNVLYSMLVWPSLNRSGFFDQTLCVFCADPIAEKTAIRLKLSRMCEANLFMKSSWNVGFAVVETMTCSSKSRVSLCPPSRQSNSRPWPLWVGVRRSETDRFWEVRELK